MVDLPAAIARYEADEEVQDLLNASPGRNLGVDFLPGSFGYDGSRPPSAEEAGAILWLDAYTANVDRTWANPNLLVWHGRTWAIDHGASLWFHHSWPSRPPDVRHFVDQPFDPSAHVLARVAAPVAETHERLAPLVTEAVVEEVVRLVPEDWLEPTASLPDADAARAAYVEHLTLRLATPAAWTGGTGMSHPYQYVVLRYVPRVDRGECLNVGVVLHSQSAGVLRCAFHLDEDRIRASPRCRRRRPARRPRGGRHDVRAPPDRDRHDPVDPGQAVRLDQRPPLDRAAARAGARWLRGRPGRRGRPPPGPAGPITRSPARQSRGPYPD